MKKLAPYLVAIAFWVPLPVYANQIFGLVIGIDDYTHIPNLDGAVNDARDIADALSGINAEVITLLDADATRDAIFSAWRGFASRMQPGDQLVVSYAGHGSNEPEHWPGNEEDGRDETLLLSGFSPYGAAAANRIRDDEIAELIALTPDAEVIFVADACYSGTVSRNISPVLGYRYFSYGKIKDDPLPPPPPNTTPNDGRGNVALFLAAVDETDKVPEFYIEGEARGALSYSFARGLRGDADLDGDNRLTKGEIATYVRRSVRGISQGVQSPQSQHTGSSDEVLFLLGDPRSATEPAPQNNNPYTSAFDDFPPVTLSSIVDNENILQTAYGIQSVTLAEPAALIMDSRDGTLRTSVGDIVSKIGQPEDAGFDTHFQAVIDKTRLVTALQALSAGAEIQVKFSGGDRNYHAGEMLTVQITGRQTKHISLFNISSDGQINFLYPLNAPSIGLDDPFEVPAYDEMNLTLLISPPFGADHVFALETQSDPTILRRVLSSYDGSRNVRAFWEQLRGSIIGMGQEPRFAVFPFHTIER